MAKKKRPPTWIVALAFLALWQTVYALKLFPSLLFPSLADIGKRWSTARCTGRCWVQRRTRCF